MKIEEISTIISLISKLNARLRKEFVEIPKQISHWISSLKRELNSITALLDDAETIGEHSNRYTVFIDEVEELVGEIEDIIDAHSFRLVDPGLVYRSSPSRRSIHRRLEDIDAKTKSLHKKEEWYKDPSVPSTSSSMDACTAHQTSPLYSDDADTVGIEEPINKITSWMMQGGGEHRVIRWCLWLE